MSELKPCPFCGGEATRHFIKTAVSNVRCKNDKCICGVLWVEDVKWNTRTQSQWVSVADEVPKIGQNYDGYHYSGRHANCGAFIGRVWDEKLIRETMQIKGYSHWMPVPLPPKVGE